jgi:hypothetical protein
MNDLSVSFRTERRGSAMRVTTMTSARARPVIRQKGHPPKSAECFLSRTCTSRRYRRHRCPSLPGAAQQPRVTIVALGRYEKSYMHRDTISHVVMSSRDFLITASVDGHLKFWKKMPGSIEFVKHYRAHLDKITGTCAHPPTHPHARTHAHARTRTKIHTGRRLPLLPLAERDM